MIDMEKPESFTGVKFSASLLFAGGSLVGLAAFTGAVVAISLISARHLQPRMHSTDLAFFLYLLVLSAFALACFRVASGLYKLQRRSRYYAVSIGLFLLAFGIWMIWVLYFFPSHPERSTGDEGEAVLLCPFLILPGAWLAVYLNLPHVYRQFNKQPQAPQ